ncbi:MAG TPA: glycoside hydrolase family 2 protein, partial [Flavobacteriales bacterium]|nr:glycoside hydrolase family 2 protein [Flavobacteriales bacterium]
MKRWLWVACWIGFRVAASAQEVHMPLNDGWSFCQVGKKEWRSAEVPGVVQTDLLRHQLIPDFMLGSNIDSVQWVENEDWIYRRNLFVADTLLRHQHLDLVFKGLDTFAEVYLNDSLIGKADNMFRTWEWDVRRALRKGDNELKVIFRSPINEGAKLR